MNAVIDFAAAFEALTGHKPFPWQCELFRRFMAEERVTACDIPTGLGKTAVMAIWLFARAAGAKLPRRLVYVVDRRAVVDQATEVALQLKEFVEDEKSAELRKRLGLNGKSLAVSTLRGQFVDNRNWLEDPSSPAIIVGTVDMIGSRLLFEGYGASRKMRPYHAGLLGADAMVVLDEAHLVPPFELMLQTVASDQTVFGAASEVAPLIPPFQLISLSATGRNSNADALRLTDDDLRHPEVTKRLDASKQLSLLDIDDPKTIPERLASEAWSLAENGHTCVRIIVFSDRRDDAEKAKRTMEKLAKGDKKKGVPEVLIETQLFVGARRVREREVAANWLKTHGFLAGTKTTPTRPSFVFATSAGEVGVDLDADHMVCDLVAWERMVQRFGRVNRRGDGDARVVVLAEAPDEKTREALSKAPTERTKGEQKKAMDYEDVLKRRYAIELLRNVREFKDASPAAIRQLKCDAESDGKLAAILKDATTPPPLRPALTRPVVDSWSMSSLEQHTGRPLVAPWLRGWIDDYPQTTVVWRRFLPLRNGKPPTPAEVNSFFESAPPHLSETLETKTDHVLTWAVKRAAAILKTEDTENVVAEDAETSCEPGLLRRNTVVAVLLGSALNVIDTLELSDFAFDSDNKKENTRRKAKLERQLQGATMVLDYRFAGLSEEGLLEMDSKQASGPPCTVDAGKEWLNSDGDDDRSNSPPTPSFRIRESTDGTASDARNWRTCLRFVSQVAEDEEPMRFLIVDKWKYAGTSEDGRSAGQLQELGLHQEWTTRKAKRLASRLGLPSDYEQMLSIVARLHDEGKRASRWQRAFSAPTDEVAYAKTPGPVRFSLLDGYRHEFSSLAALEADHEFNTLDDNLKDLGRHLVVAHHGFGRPVIRVDGCADAPPSALEDRARNVALRFARLQKRWGPWGLAWWETLLRAADQQASRDNESSNDSHGSEDKNG